MVAKNVEFVLAEIDRLPLPDDSVDCILSNCVINLVPDKSRAFSEMLRVLKPGGRLAISDIALRQPLPDRVRTSIEAYVGCISGAMLMTEYREQLRQAGFADVAVTETGADLSVYAQAGQLGCCSTGESSCCGSTEPAGTVLHDQLAALIQQFDVNVFAASVMIHALKPLAGTSSSD